MRFRWTEMTRAEKDRINAVRRARRAERRRLGLPLHRVSRPLSREKQSRHNAYKRRRWAQMKPARDAANAAKAAAKAERLRQYPWLRKIPKAERVRCPLCQEVHGGIDAHDCANALGRAIGREKQAAHRAEKAAWVCPPCPMPQEDR